MAMMMAENIERERELQDSRENERDSEGKKEG